jgi:hypothetical protein
MGMDIYSQQGIVFTVSELLPKIFKFKKQQLESLISALCKDVFPENEEEKTNLLRTENSEDFIRWFEDLVARSHNGEYYEDTGTLERVWGAATDELGLDLPNATFEWWDSRRLQGYDVPIQEHCIVLDDSQVFETKLSDYGKKVAKILKQRNLKSTTWTVMSV